MVNKVKSLSVELITKVSDYAQEFRNRDTSGECYLAVHRQMCALLRDALDKVQSERDRQYEFNAESIAKIAALEAVIADYYEALERIARYDSVEQLCQRSQTSDQEGEDDVTERRRLTEIELDFLANLKQLKSDYPLPYNYKRGEVNYMNDPIKHEHSYCPVIPPQTNELPERIVMFCSCGSVISVKPNES